jgi:hypothetical protein
MHTRANPGPQVIHRLPGRVRIHLPTWPAQSDRSVEEHFSRLPGVRSVHAEALTGNVLIRFDPQQTRETEVMAAAARIGSASLLQANHVQQEDTEPGRLPAPLRGLLCKVLVDALWALAVNVGPLGLPAGALWAVQLGLDVVSWGAALTPHQAATGPSPAGQGGISSSAA